MNNEERKGASAPASGSLNEDYDDELMDEGEACASCGHDLTDDEASEIDDTMAGYCSLCAPRPWLDGNGRAVVLVAAPQAGNAEGVPPPKGGEK